MLEEMFFFIGEEKLHIYLQRGFFHSSSNSTGFHKHLYSEIHLMVSGQTEFLIDKQHFVLSAGKMIIIPAKTYHSNRNIEENTRRISFQITKELTQLQMIQIDKTVASLFANEIATYTATGNSNHLGSYLSLICSHIPGCTNTSPVTSQDRKFIINEFFQKNYNRDISLQKLASILGVSKKHAGRLVEKYTGNCFQDELHNRRMDAAKYLIENTDMSMDKIAEQVGYETYSGFWKFYNKKR